MIVKCPFANQEKNKKEKEKRKRKKAVNRLSLDKLSLVRQFGVDVYFNSPLLKIIEGRLTQRGLKCLVKRGKDSPDSIYRYMHVITIVL